jgi:hypothetical protein
LPALDRKHVQATTETESIHLFGQDVVQTNTDRGLRLSPERKMLDSEGCDHHGGAIALFDSGRHVQHGLDDGSLLSNPPGVAVPAYGAKIPSNHKTNRILCLTSQLTQMD